MRLQSRSSKAQLELELSTHGGIAAELAEAVFGGHHYRVLFMLGALLFVVTFVSNLIADQVIHGLKHKLEGKR